ncbi:MAG: methyltransferase domain-containing protein [Magnetococcales bacterium]|nr:methyltransferase domain-containing protein [Magnetococcales bacterium]
MHNQTIDLNPAVCRICRERNPQPLLNFGPQPIAHRILEQPVTSEERFPLSVHLCPTCGLVQNLSPIDSEILYRNYNYCFSSWKPQPHVVEEIALLREQVGQGAVFEIGCNDGMFLEQLRHAGFAPVVGVEPNGVASGTARDKGFTVHTSMLTAQVCEQALRQHGPFKAVVIRQVLEHLADIHHAFDRMESLLDKDGLLLIEVPDFDIAMEQGDCSVLWEEHVNFFTEPVLQRLLGMRGFAPVTWRKYDFFSGGVLMVLARRMEKPVDWLATGPTLDQGLAFADKVNRYSRYLLGVLRRWRDAGGSVALYGVGARACTVVNALELGPYIDLSVDDQTERQEKYMPGSRLPIRAPQAMTGLNGPLLVLLAVNSENEARVKHKMSHLLGTVETLSLCSPTDIFGELDTLVGRMECRAQVATY